MFMLLHDREPITIKKNIKNMILSGIRSSFLTKLLISGNMQKSTSIDKKLDDGINDAHLMIDH